MAWEFSNRELWLESLQDCCWLPDILSLVPMYDQVVLTPCDTAQPLKFSWCTPSISVVMYSPSVRPVYLSWFKGDITHLHRNSRTRLPCIPSIIYHHCHKWNIILDAWVQVHWIGFQLRLYIITNQCQYSYPPSRSWRHQKLQWPYSKVCNWRISSNNSSFNIEL